MKGVLINTKITNSFKTTIFAKNRKADHLMNFLKNKKVRLP